MAGDGDLVAGGWWAHHRPDARLIQRGVRAAVVVPAMVALGAEVVKDADFTFLAAFGAFAMLVATDLGGRRREARRALLAVIGVGAVLLSVGSLVSPYVWPAAAVLFLLVFGVETAAVLGGYVSASVPALLTPLVVSIMLPITSPGQVLWRGAGWLTAGVVVLVVTRWWWPTDAPWALRRALADSCRRLADLADEVARSTAAPAGASGLDPSRLADAGKRLQAARIAYVRDPNRPAGPRRQDQAVALLFEELTRAMAALERWTPRPLTGDAVGLDAAHRALARTVADTLAASAEAIDRDQPADVDLVALEDQRAAHLQALERWVAQAAAEPGSADQVVDAVDEVFPMRVLSFAALTIAANAVVAGGGAVDPSTAAVQPRLPTERPGATLRRLGALVSAHVRPGSVWFRNSLRAAIALSGALVVADLAQLGRGFWVVLGTLTVLRSSVAATGRTALQVVLGNAVGVVLTAALLSVVADVPSLLWVLLAAAVIVTTLGPSYNLVVAQTAFCTMVVVLVELLQPGTLGAGETRLIDVSVGVGVSLVVALVLWPRGASVALRGAMARLLRADADALHAEAVDALDPGATSVPSTKELDVVGRQAEEAFRQYLTERGAKRVGVDDWSTVLGVGLALGLAADSLGRLEALGLRVDGRLAGTDTARQLAEAWDRRRMAIERVADRMTAAAESPPSADAADAGPVAVAPATGPSDDRTRALDALRRDLGSGWATAEDSASVVGLAVAAEWLGVVDHMLEVVEPAVAAVEVHTGSPWWR